MKFKTIYIIIIKEKNIYNLSYYKYNNKKYS